MVTPHRFKYDGIFSNELNIPDLITCVAFDSDSGDVETRLAREAVSSESFDGRYKRTHQYKYTETFGCTFTLMKSNFGDFTQEEVRTVLKWLTQKDTTALLEVYYDDSNVVSWASIGGFVNLSLRKLANHRTVAIIAEWDSVHPFCLSDLHTVTKAINSLDNKITIEIDTDDNKPIYPRITIQQKGTAGDVKITNQHYDFFNKASAPVVTTIKNNGQTEKIIVDGANKIISSSNTNRIFGDDFVGWTWLPLYDGKNELTVVGNCEIKLEYRTVIKCGEY